jgi:hypothetical protein
MYHHTQLFFLFKMGSCKLFFPALAWDLSLPNLSPKELGLQAHVTGTQPTHFPLILTTTLKIDSFSIITHRLRIRDLGENSSQVPASRLHIDSSQNTLLCCFSLGTVTINVKIIA